MNTKTTKKPRSSALRPVVVTTAHRGVFFGYASAAHKDDAPNIKLTKMRNCLYWCQALGGVMGLASTGPMGDCRIGAAVPSATLRDVTAVVECTPAAAKAWEAFPCVS